MKLYTHESFEKGIPLTAEDYNAKWHELNVKYFGPDMVVDNDIDIEWARIPHFYSDFTYINMQLVMQQLQHLLRVY